MQMLSNPNIITPGVKTFIPPVTLAKSSGATCGPGQHRHRAETPRRQHCSELGRKANPGQGLYQPTSCSLIPKRSGIELPVPESAVTMATEVPILTAVLLSLNISYT